MALQLRSHVQNILCASGEGRCNKIKVLLNGKSNILFVLFAEEGEGKLDARNIDAFSSGDRPAIDHGTENVCIRSRINAQFDQAIVDQDFGAGHHFHRKLGKSDACNCVVAHYIS